MAPGRLPSSVSLCEVGPRDGFQFEEKAIPTDLKVEVIGMLVEAGVRRVQVASFVHPARVPQMADAEEVCRRLSQIEGVVYSGLVLNRKGVERAHVAGLGMVDVSIATNERHAQDNTNMSVADAVAQAEDMISAAQGYGMQAQMGFQTVFGYREPGDTPLDQIVELSRRFAGLGIESLSLADSTGMANPVMIRERVGAVREAAGNVPIVLHLHDTRGLGLANVHAALELGIGRFDTSLGGLGGCPFIPGATGNIATEDTVYLLESMGISTGIDWRQVAGASRRMEAFLGRQLPGKMHRLIRLTNDD